MKIAYQGIAGSYSESCAKKIIQDVKLFHVKHLMNVLKWLIMIEILKQLYQSQIKQQEILV